MLVRPLSNRELATVLAALRLWQADVSDNDAGIPADFVEFFDDHAPLTADEIDALCDRLNTKETTR